MKTILFFCLILIMSSSSFTQEKGSIAVGGRVAYEKSSEDNATTESINERISVSPYAGYFISENLMIGVGFEYSYYHYQYTFSTIQSNESTDRMFFIQPFLKYYWQISDRFRLHSRLLVMFGFGSSESTSRFNPGIPSVEDKTEYDINGIGLSLSPGMSYIINSWLTLEASVGNFSYSKYNYELSGAETSESGKRENENLNLTFSLSSVSIGVQLTL